MSSLSNALSNLFAALKHSPSKKKLTARGRATSVGDGAGVSSAELNAISQESGDISICLLLKVLQDV